MAPKAEKKPAAKKPAEEEPAAEKAPAGKKPKAEKRLPAQGRAQDLSFGYSNFPKGEIFFRQPKYIFIAHN